MHIAHYIGGGKCAANLVSVCYFSLDDVSVWQFYPLPRPIIPSKTSVIKLTIDETFGGEQVYINRLYLMQIPVEKCYQTVKVEGEGEGEEEGTIDNGLDDSSITFDKSIGYIDEDDMEEVRALSVLYSR